jgi:hypothetical protein
MNVDLITLSFAGYRVTMSLFIILEIGKQNVK